MPDNFKTALFFLLLLLFCSSAQAQKTITGTIQNAETDKVLVSATISVEGTYRGTISNENGVYTLSIADSLLPATVQVRYIGFESEQRVIEHSSVEEQHFNLEPSVMELEEIVITDEDPGVRIMRRVIERKQEWREQLKTYRAQAYTRQTLANDTSIVMITESFSEAFWDHEQGHREVIKSKNQSANIDAAENFAGVSYLPNFYDDNIEIAGFDVVGVTHPDALKFYDFELLNRTVTDDRLVYEIEVIPARNLQPLFEGTVQVLGEEYALLQVKLRPNSVVDFPPPVRTFGAYYEQQFNNYGKDFWLPVDVRINGDIKISMVGLEFPQIQFRQVAQITDYRINESLPDSIFASQTTISEDSTATGDSLFVRSFETIPLTEEEEKAYSQLDSTTTLEKAFEPSGFLTRFIDDDSEEDNPSGSGTNIIDSIPGQFTPKMRFNRVDELFAGLKYDLPVFEDVQSYIQGGYSTGNRSWDYGIGSSYAFSLSDDVRQNIGIDFIRQTQPRFQSHLYTPSFTIVPNLLGERDYFDYYRNEGWSAHTRIRHLPSDLSLRIGYNNERHILLAANSTYDLLGRSNALQPNPEIDEGRLSSLSAGFGYNFDPGITLGATGIQSIRGNIEFSDEMLGSDFNFTTYRLGIDWNFTTFYARRFMPNTLDIKLEAGTASGELPIQKMGIVDASLGYFSPFGALKTVRNNPYEGQTYLSMNVEHNFRTIPFEWVGLNFLADRNYGIIVFGGAARTWLSNEQETRLLQQEYMPRTADQFHLEAGLSLNGVLGLFRIDFARRLDERAFLINVNVARFF